MDELARAAADVLARVRARRPLVHHITNGVVMNDAANVTLHLGALPVMAVAAEEVAEMAAQADALVLNLGTPTEERVASALIAGAEANALNVPVVLDPVGVGATGYRTAIAGRILETIDVAVIRGNAGEIGVLAETGGRVRGVESVTSGADPLVAASVVARSTGAVVALTGPEDVVIDGRRSATVANGHSMLAAVAGTGCMATTAIACCLAVEPDGLVAAAAGLAAFGLAGERAAGRAAGPGSFKVALFDALAALAPGDLLAGARLVERQEATG